MTATVLVVDDDKGFRQLSEAALRRQGYRVQLSATATEALSLVRRDAPDVVILERNLPDGDGLTMLRRMANGSTDPPVVVIATSHGELEDAVEALKLGAFDYLTKPIKLPEFLCVIRKASEARQLRRASRLSEATAAADRAGPCAGVVVDPVAESARMTRVVELCREVACHPDTTVLIEGECGTGKRLLARFIHAVTPKRRARPFASLRCDAGAAVLDPKLAPSRARPTSEGGVLGEGGTVLLERVDELSPTLQRQMIDVLEAHSSGAGVVDDGRVRFIATTVRDLELAVRTEAFRRDLFDRIDVFRIQVPPLRERREDILPLARFFLRMFASRAGKRIEELDRGAEERLLGHSFPGNVRELRNAIERAVVLEHGPALSANGLTLRVDDASERPRAVVAWAEPAPTADGRGNVPPSRQEVERAYLVRLLENAAGNRSKVARWMGVSYPTVLKKIACYGIDVTQFKSATSARREDPASDPRAVPARRG